MLAAVSLAARRARGVFLGLASGLDRLLQTGSRRSEFERLYLESDDPWQYRTSAEEHAKYALVLAKALQWAPRRTSALEVGCSVGVFTRSLAAEFGEVVATDVSQAALDHARRYNQDASNIRFVRADVRRDSSGGGFDVIVCSEVLYYVVRRDVEAVLSRLARGLAPDGVLIVANEYPEAVSDRFHFKGWTSLLEDRWLLRDRAVVVDAARPYQVSVFSLPPADRPSPGAGVG